MYKAQGIKLILINFIAEIIGLAAKKMTLSLTGDWQGVLFCSD
jgi:hypothetical protein